MAARATHAVVLGGGLAGTLAAAALAGHADHITLVERDRMPAGPQERTGVPQARHAHMLMSSGAEAIDALVPGVTKSLYAAGAHRVSVRKGLVSSTAQGWVPRSADLQYVITCGRALLDWTVRERVLMDPRVTLLQGTDVTGLDGDSRRVTAVRVRDRATGEASLIGADLVVDATGRGSAARTWLEELGIPRVREETVDTGLAYSTRLFRVPPGAERDFPAVTVMPSPADPVPGRSGTLLPIEDGRWLVTLTGLRPAQPPTDDAGFLPFARTLRTPVIGDLIEAAQPLGPVCGSRSTANRRRYYEELSLWPDGFVALGDALAAFNPVYGHGMSVAAKAATALRTDLERYGYLPERSRHVQRAVAATVNDAWALAVGQDVQYPDVIGPRPGAAAKLMRRYSARAARASATRPAVAAAIADIFTLSAPVSRLLAPRAVLGALRGPGAPPLTAPPFTERERALFSRDPREPARKTEQDTTQ
ncbi:MULTISPECIES: FAD-dependent oxidoreductase [unclassified Streptomyces]|uniref:FAD-dependent oxidoreductase n=1 Tax=unclassified Streptomyces TaxID=2593676 RepID=UPI002E7915E1|nr:FAD-dependent oxidoreductase [Streptomyces sp. JV176]MEE1802149.1 FAD-dependent oxidoreductase [Streptomyces sp. JV176]